MISFDCQCGRPFRFSLKFRGREFRCTTCGRSLVVPEESLTPDIDDIAPVGSGKAIVPVAPGSLLDEHDEDEIIITGDLPKIKEEENAFSIDLDENESTSTILSKAAISQQMKAAQAAEAAPEEKPAKKAGLLSGFFKKKAAVPNVIDITEGETAKPTPAPKTKEKASKKQPKAETASEKPKKAGFLGGFFKKKPKITDAAEGHSVKPAPAKKEPKVPAPKKEKVKKAGFLGGLFKKKPKATDATGDE